MDFTSEGDAELRARVRRQEVVADLGQRALEVDDLDRLMHDASAAVAETLGNDYCKVLELLPGGDEVFLRQGVGWHEGLVGDATVPTDLDSQAGYTLLSEEPVVVDDLRTEERFSGPDLLTDHDVVSGISVVIGSVESPWGILGTHTTERREFTEHDVNFVKSVANVLASTIENERTRRRLTEETRVKERIVDTSPVGIVTVGADGTIGFANERAEEIYGRSEEEIRTYSHDDPRWDLVDSQGSPLPGDEAPFERVIEAGEPIFDAELGLRRPDGTRVWISVNGSPLVDGEDAGAVFAFTDVTERKRLKAEFEEILGRVDDAFYAVDDEFRFTHVNERAEQLLQRPEEELLGEVLWEVFPSAAAIDEVWDAFHAALETQEATSYEVYYDTLGFWVEANVYPSETGLSVYFRDITERVERERELERTERRFEATFQDPNILVGLLEPDGTVLDINETAMEYIDTDLDEVVGRPFWETPWWGEAETVRSEVEQWIERAAAGEYVDFEADLVRPNGRRYTINGVFRPVTDDEGEVVSLLVSDRDITERKRRERQLRKSEQRYRTLAENFPNGIVTMFDDDLRYTLAAGRGFDDLPLSPADVEGRPVREVWPDDVSDPLGSAFESALDGEMQAIELQYVGREWVVHVVPITDGDGAVFGGMTIAQDITERVEREQDLEESNERLEQFAYAASHDLQEPLRMVSSYLQLIESRYADALDADGEEFIEFAVDGADRMREMIDGLLAYSRVESRGKPFEPVDLESVVANVRDDLRLRIEEHDAEITVEELPRVEGDDGQLRQVFQNLLDNAIEYSGDEPPRVHVSAERSGSTWTIAVRDEGIGIDPEKTADVFEVFQRLHSREEHDGTGIGLALCQRIVERHGGDIRADSEPGEGTTVSFTLPATRNADR